MVHQSAPSSQRARRTRRRVVDPGLVLRGATCLLLMGLGASTTEGLGKGKPCFLTPRATDGLGGASGGDRASLREKGSLLQSTSRLPGLIRPRRLYSGAARLHVTPVAPFWPVQSPHQNAEVLPYEEGPSRREAGGLPGGPSSPDTPWGFIFSAAAAILISYADRGNLATCILPMAESLGWSLGEQSLVLSSFFLGYAVTQVVGGTLADRYGGERVLEAGVLFWSLLTLLTPWAASQGVMPAIMVRIGLGLGEGVAFPAVHAMIPSYVPVERRSVAVAVVTAASYVGAVLAFGLTPWLIQQTGWQSVFYCFGALPAVWFPAWWIFRGRRLEEGGAGGQPLALPPAASDGQDTRQGGRLTWSRARRILTCRPVLAILLAQYCGSWGLYGLLSWLPSYYSKTFGVDVSALAPFTVGPYVAQTLVGVASGSIADGLIARGWRVVTVRKTLQVLGSLLPAIFLVLATANPWTAASSSSITSSFLYVTAGAAASALTLAAVSVNHLDVCPKNAGFTFAAGNTLATIAGLVSVPVSGLLLERTGSFTAVFACFAAHYLVGAALYAWLAGGEDVTAQMECDLD